METPNWFTVGAWMRVVTVLLVLVNIIRAEQERNMMNKESEWRVLRGGSWPYTSVCTRCADRGSYDPSFMSYGIGFRVVALPRGFRWPLGL